MAKKLIPSPPEFWHFSEPVGNIRGWGKGKGSKKAWFGPKICEAAASDQPSPGRCRRSVAAWPPVPSAMGCINQRLFSRHLSPHELPWAQVNSWCFNTSPLTHLCSVRFVFADLGLIWGYKIEQSVHTAFELDSTLPNLTRTLNHTWQGKKRHLYVPEWNTKARKA